MKFEVMSRANARQYSFNPNIEDCIIISIVDTMAEPNRFNRHNPHIKAVLPLFFDDVDGDAPNHMERKDAEKIIKFVNLHIDKVEKIVVHCEAGICRSAGTCAALMFILTGSDKDIFENPRFSPNMHCYRTVLNTYFGHYNMEAIDSNCKHNIEVWREANKDFFE